jgi:hypothetical protein
MNFKIVFLLACFLTGLISHSQTVQQKINQYRKENESKIIDEYVKFLAISECNKRYSKHSAQCCVYKNDDGTAGN